MTIDWTKPIQQRNGRAARVLATDLKQSIYPIAAAAYDDKGIERVATYMPDGRFLATSYGNGDRDLINVPPKPVITELFINLYPHSCMAAPLAPTAYAFPSLEYAEAPVQPGRHGFDLSRALIKVTLTDGVVTGAELVSHQPPQEG